MKNRKAKTFDGRARAVWSIPECSSVEEAEGLSPAPKRVEDVQDENAKAFETIDRISHLYSAGERIYYAEELREPS